MDDETIGRPAPAEAPNNATLAGQIATCAAATVTFAALAHAHFGRARRGCGGLPVKTDLAIAKSWTGLLSFTSQ